MKNILLSFCLIGVVSGCAVTERIEPVVPISDNPTAVETAVGVGVAAALVGAAALMISLAVVVNDAAD